METSSKNLSKFELSIKDSIHGMFCMKSILIIFLAISIIVPAFKDGIQKISDIVKSVFIHHSDSFSLCIGQLYVIGSYT